MQLVPCILPIPKNILKAKVLNVRGLILGILQKQVKNLGNTAYCSLPTLTGLQHTSDTRTEVPQERNQFLFCFTQRISGLCKSRRLLQNNSTMSCYMDKPTGPAILRPFKSGIMIYWLPQYYSNVACSSWASQLPSYNLAIGFIELCLVSSGRRVNTHREFNHDSYF